MHDQRAIREQRGGPEIACQGKVRYDAPQKAAKAAQRMARAKHAPLVSFRCPYCRGWHVGNSSGLKRKLRAR